MESRGIAWRALGPLLYPYHPPPYHGWVGEGSPASGDPGGLFWTAFRSSTPDTALQLLSQGGEDYLFFLLP